MGDIVRWPHHVRVRHEHRNDGCDDDTRCSYCQGGLFTCAVCGASEGELPTECPGERMHEHERAAVLNGHIDYVGGGWVCRSPLTPDEMEEQSPYGNIRPFLLPVLDEARQRVREMLREGIRRHLDDEERDR